MRRFTILLSALLSAIPSFAQSVVVYSYDTAGNRSGRAWGTGLLSLPETPLEPTASLMPNTSGNTEETAGPQIQIPSESRDALERRFPLILNDEQKEQLFLATLAENEAAENAWWKEYEKRAPERSMNTSYSVGAIPFEEGVSPSGARTYSIPIATAAGFKLVPSVALSYNSQAAEGWAGYGWDIQGIPCIRLINKNEYYHGEIKAANATDSDPKFALDGVPLVLNEHSATNTYYELETATGHILAHPVFNSYNRISKFDVLYPNGVTAVFGRNASYNYNLVYYMLTELHDLDGNKITFTYTADSQAGLDRPSAIRYGYDSGGNNYSGEITFSYSVNSSAPTRYYAGRQVKYGSILSSVESRSDGEVLSQYSLTYVERDHVHLLSRVDCASGSAALPPLEFTYGTAPSSAYMAKDVPSSIDLEPTQFSPGVPHVYKRGKFMANEYRDGIIIYPAAPILNETAFLIPRLEAHSSAMPSLTMDQYTKTFEAADIDGDGVDEIIRIGTRAEDYDTSAILVTVYKCNSTGTPVGLYNHVIYVPGACSLSQPYTREYHMGDFDGDGKAELLMVAYNQSEPVSPSISQTSYTTLIDPRTGTVLCNQELFVYPHDKTNCLVVNDIDNDGRTELCYADNSGFKIYRQQSSGSFSLEMTLSAPTATNLSSTTLPRHDADLNGDGYPDILIPYSGYSSWVAYYFTGSSYVLQSINVMPGTSSDRYMFMDINRDGMSDVILISGTSIYTAVNLNGSSFDLAEVSPSGLTSMSAIVPVNASAYNRPSSFIQIDSVTVNNYTFNAIAPVIRRVDGAQDSNGRILHNSYAYLPSYAQTWHDSSLTVDASQGYSFRTLPIYVLVQEYEYLTSSSSTLYKSNTYEYFNGAYHSRGLGFCGFSRIRSRELASVTQIIKFVTDEYHGAEKRGALTKVEKRYASLSASPFLTVINTWDNHSTTYGKLNPRMTKSVTTDALTGVGTSTDYTYDSWDFLTGSKTTRTLSGQTTQREMQIRTYQHNNSATKYVLGSVTQEATTWDLDGNTTRKWKDKQVYTLDTNFHPVTRKSYTGIVRGGPPTNPFYESTDSTKLVKETRWVYDSHGNVTSEKSAPYGATTFTGHTYSYDANGRYMLTDTDALGRTTTYAGYNKFGKPSTVTDYRNRVTSYTYDTWGNVSVVSRPDGGTEQYSRSWADGGQYYVYRTASGKPETIVHYDGLDREVRSGVRRFDGQWQFTAKQYNRFGLLSKVSLPYRGTSASYWNTYTYDGYDRPKKILEASGKQTTWSYSGTSVTMVKEGISSTSTKDASGNVISVTDPGGTVTYTLRDDGQPSAVIAPGSVTTTFVYDGYGRRTKLIDPSAGTQTEAYVWNSDGSSQQTHTGPNGSVTTSKDRYGRTTSVQRAGEYNTTYTYNAYGLLSSESSTNGTGTEYTYDNMDRVATVKETVPDSRWLQKTYTYGAGSNVSTIKYTTQDGDITTETYSYANGNNSGITISDGTVVWSLVSENDLGMATQITSGSISREYGFTAYGLPTYRKMAGGSLQHVTYQFNAANGNLTSRSDVVNGQTENFAYDTLNRLTAIGSRSISYDIKGNILSMDGVGSMGYGNSLRPYQVTVLDPSSSTLVPSRQQSITYTCYDRPSTLTEGSRTATFTYNGAGERVKMYVADSGSQVLTRYYIGGRYEYDQTQSGGKDRLYLGGDAYSAPMVLQRTGSGNWTAYNIGRDYLGNITQIASTGGTLVAEYGYDPWGRLRDPETLGIYSPGYEPDLFLGRGFTGHEHLTWFGLVNMNARLYDPLVGRFLSPDPYVQAPDCTQGFNRYSYALNNPLKYTDPRGEFWNYIIGALIGGVGNLISNWSLIKEKGFLAGLGYFAVGAAVGALSAGGAVWAASAMKAAGVWAGALVGAGTGALSGAVSNSLITVGNNVISSSKWNYGLGQAALNGAIFGAIGGAISGGIKGYAYAKQNNANPWTNRIKGSETTYERPVKTGVPTQLNSEEYCYAHSSAYADSDHGNHSFEEFILAEKGAKGADVSALKQLSGAELIAQGDMAELGERMNQIGGALCKPQMEVLATVASGDKSHWVNIVKIVTSSRLNMFGSGTSVALDYYCCWNPATGLIESRSVFSFLKVYRF